MRVAVVIAALVALVAPRATVPRLDHVIVVVFENEDRSAVLQSADAPTFRSLAARYADLTSYDAVAHPSLPNYLALVGGSTFGTSSDCTDCSARPPSIGTLLTRAHESWGAYAEGYPGSPRFAKKHEPFLYFPRQASYVHALSALDAKRLPRFAFVSPDLCNDGHDCGVGTADRFLARFIGPLLAIPRTAIFVVFDEGVDTNHVAAIVAGTAVRAHSTDAHTLTHYSLLRTVEDALGLPRLRASAGARPIEGIWR